MKKLGFALVAAIAVFLGGSGSSEAQAPRAPGGFMPGQAYMMMPAGAAPAGAFGPGGVSPASYVAQAGCTTGGCTAAGCTTPGCTGSCLDGCCAEGWCHDMFAFGGFTYLRPRDAEVAYATESNNNNPAVLNAVQIGRIGVVDPDYQPGFFVGLGKVIDDCSSISFQYSMFEATTTNSITRVVPGNIIRSLVTNPLAMAGNYDGTTASANLNINYDLLDVDYRNLIAYDCDYKLNYLVGLRMGQMKQQFSSRFSSLGTNTVNTNVDFYGGGARLGLEGERYTTGGLMVYGKSFFSVLPGEFKTRYNHFDNANNAVVSPTWKAGRIVSILDLELGMGWRNKCDTVRVNVGYVFSEWMNVVKTDQWIKGVQNNNFVDMSDHMTFDGLVARIEARW